MGSASGIIPNSCEWPSAAADDLLMVCELQSCARRKLGMIIHTDHTRFNSRSPPPWSNLRQRALAPGTAWKRIDSPSALVSRHGEARLVFDACVKAGGRHSIGEVVGREGLPGRPQHLCPMGNLLSANRADQIRYRDDDSRGATLASVRAGAFDVHNSEGRGAFARFSRKLCPLRPMGFGPTSDRRSGPLLRPILVCPHRKRVVADRMRWNVRDELRRRAESSARIPRLQATTAKYWAWPRTDLATPRTRAGGPVAGSVGHAFGSTGDRDTGLRGPHIEASSDAQGIGASGPLAPSRTDLVVGR